MSILGLESHSSSTIKIGGKTKSNIPFCGRHFNRPQVITSTKADSCTQSQFADDMDINRIVKLYSKAGIPVPPVDNAVYGIEAPTDDFALFAQKLEVAKANFLQLPAELRAQFDNDVNLFARFLNSSSDDDVKSVLQPFGLFKDEEAPSVDCDIQSMDPAIKDNVDITESAKPVLNDLSAS